MNPFDLLFVICHVQYYEKKWPLFFALERLPSFKVLCFQQPHRYYRNDFKIPQLLTKILFGPLQSVLWRLSHSIILGKFGQKLLSSWKQLFFEMFVYIDLLFLKNWTYHFHSDCQKTFRTLISCSLRSVVLDTTRRSWPNFFTGKVSFFFQQPHRS